MRDRYDWQLECPTCGAKGYARTSEDAFPDVGQLNFSIDELSDGFRIDTLGEFASNTVIVCAKCNVIA